MNIQYPDYSNCISGFSTSVLNHFGVDTGGRQGLSALDALLKKKDFQNVVVLLLDGMGTAIVEKNLDANGFFARHLVTSFSSVFPPTTVAATTSYDSGLNPVEHSWLGWDCYYPDIGKNVTVFPNTETGTDIPAAEYHAAKTFCGYESVISRIQAAGGQAYYASPFKEPFPEDFDAICSRIQALCKAEGRKYIYAYWPQPDSTMHASGCHNPRSVEILRKLERKVQALSGELENTLLIVTADHGHIDLECVALEDYPEILDCLVRMPSIEPRALNFFVRENCRETFVPAFTKAFGDKFLLLSREEVKARQLFGPGTPHPKFDGMLGDYLAVAVDRLAIFNTRKERDIFKAGHAGLTKDEMQIPLIAISK